MKNIILFVTILMLSSHVWAQLNIEPGLWELRNEVALGQGDQKTDITNQILASKGLIDQQLKEAMEKADDQQKAMMQDALGAIDQASDQQTYCLTKQDAQKGLVYTPDDVESCKIKKNEIKKQAWHVEMVCHHQGHKAHIVMDGQLKDSKHYTIQSLIKAKGQTVSTKHEGRFVSQSCAVK